jgi:hypothetical protein
VVNDNLAAPAPAQRSGGLPAAAGRRVPRRPTAPAADIPALRSGASPHSPRRGAAEPPLRSVEWNPEMVTVQFDDLSAAFDFVSFAAPFEHRAFVSLDTGAIYWISETNPIAEEDLPDDLETSDRYIAIPHKTELGLGNNLALRFVEEQLPGRYRDVEGFFRRRGAYARFKELLAAEGCLEKWYAFEAESTERALRHWCKANEIHVAEGGTQQSA